MADARPRTPHVAALDGLRGVAILAVVAFHTGHLPGGFLGVDLFFGLSGYLITAQLMTEARSRATISVLGFWGRRVRRLFPALAAMLVATTVAVSLTEPAAVVRTTLSDGPWVQLDLLNWHLLAVSAGYWDRFGDPHVFEHLWSIAVEEQFYLVWPLVVLGVAGRGRRREGLVVAVALIASVVSLLLMVSLLDRADPTRVYTGTDTRAFSLLLGAVVVTAPGRRATLRVVGARPAATSALLIAGLVAAALLTDGPGSVWLFRGGLFGFSLATSGLIVLCVESPRAIAVRTLSWRPLVWLGSISYGLYLWHWPIVVMTSSLRGRLGEWPWTAVVLSLATVIAALSRYVVEDPIRDRAAWARGRLGILAFAGGTVALAALWIALPAPEPARIDIRRLGATGRAAGSSTASAPAAPARSGSGARGRVSIRRSAR